MKNLKFKYNFFFVWCGEQRGEISSYIIQSLDVKQMEREKINYNIAYFSLFFFLLGPKKQST